MAENEDCHEFDLPVMSNVHQILIKHFILDLSSDIVSRSFCGTATYFIHPVSCVKADAISTFPQYENSRKESNEAATALTPEQDDCSPSISTQNDGSVRVNPCCGESKGLRSQDQVMQKAEKTHPDLCRENHVYPSESIMRIDKQTCDSRALGCSEEISNHRIVDNLALNPDNCASATDKIYTPGSSDCNGGVERLCHFNEEIQLCGQEKNVVLKVTKGKEEKDNDMVNTTGPASDQDVFVGLLDTEKLDVADCLQQDHSGITELEKLYTSPKTGDCLSIINKPDSVTCMPGECEKDVKENESNVSPVVRNVGQMHATESKSNMDCEHGTCEQSFNHSADIKENLSSGQLGRNSSSFVSEESKTGEVFKVFQFILDSCDIDVISVDEVIWPEREVMQEKSAEKWKEMLWAFKHHDKHSFTTRPLLFSVEKWCIKIEKPGVKSAEDFPSCVRVKYKTKPKGGSLKWCLDQDGKYVAGSILLHQKVVLSFFKKKSIILVCFR